MIAKTITKIMWGRVLMHNKVITPEQWSACVVEHARNNGTTPIEQVLVQQQVLKAKQVEMILPKVQQLAQKHAYEFIPVPKTASKLAAAAAAASRASAAAVESNDAGAIPLADPAMERLHGPDVGVTLPPPGFSAPAQPAKTSLRDDGTIDLAVGEHDALSKANEVDWASDMDANNEEAPVNVQQMTAQRAAKRGIESDQLNADGTIQLAD